MRLGTTFAVAIISSLLSSVASEHINATGTDEDYKHWFDVRSDGYFYVLERHGDSPKDFKHEELWRATLSDDKFYHTVSNKDLEKKGWKISVTAHYERRGKEEVGIPFK